MDDDHAVVLLGAVLSEYERRSNDALNAAIGRTDRREVRPPNGARFEIEVNVDRVPSGAFQVRGRIFDGHGGELRRVFRRLPDGFIEYV